MRITMGLLLLTMLGCSPAETSDRRSKFVKAKDIKNPDGESAFEIRDGEIISSDEIPYTGVLLLELDDGFAAICTAVQLRDNVIITAAHCLHDDLELRTAENFFYGDFSTPDEEGILVHPIDRLEVRPEYNPAIVEDLNDIAIMRLEVPLEQQEYATLETKESFTTQGAFPPGHFNTTVIGYGEDALTSAPEKRRGTVTWASTQNEGRIYRFRPGPTDQISCPGDSGGPAIRNGQVIGLTRSGRSFGTCETVIDADYTALHYHYSWIKFHEREFTGDTSIFPWQNPNDRHDVNNDGHVSAGDALHVINALGRSAGSNGQITLDEGYGFPPEVDYLDVNANNSGSAGDALQVINQLARNQESAAFPVGESLPYQSYSADAGLLIEAEEEDGEFNSAQVYGMAALEMDADLNLHSYGYFNLLGLQEKWMYSSTRGWHFITPDGLVRDYVYNEENYGKVRGYFNSSYYDDPTLLTEPPSIEDLIIPAGEHRMFVTSSAYTGNLGGISGADNICNNHASAAGLGSSGWKAILSTSWQSARNRIVIDGPVYTFRQWFGNTTKTLVANNATEFWSGQLQSNLAWDENLGYHSNAIVFSGSTSSGYSTNKTCSNWTSSGTYVNNGKTAYSDGRWLDYYNNSAVSSYCSNAARLYCIK
jgi:V8-like Glu-specific endopeptidase